MKFWWRQERVLPAEATTRTRRGRGAKELEEASAFRDETEFISSLVNDFEELLLTS